jgi:hypothetical protein
VIGLRLGLGLTAAIYYVLPDTDSFPGPPMGRKKKPKYIFIIKKISGPEKKNFKKGMLAEKHVLFEHIDEKKTTKPNKPKFGNPNFIWISKSRFV